MQRAVEGEENEGQIKKSTGHRAQGTEHRAQRKKLRAQGTVTGRASRAGHASLAGRANYTRPARHTTGQSESCIGWIPSCGGVGGGFLV